jgi:OFA family oxalate/formate antiporter-like MFS transporter
VGWLVVIASLYTLFLSSGILFSFFRFYRAMQIEWGWAVIELFIVFLISILIIGVMFEVTRRLKDRFGVRLAVSIGILLLGLSCLWMSQIRSYIQLLVFWGILAGVGIGSGIASSTSTMRIWFPKRQRLRFIIIGVGLGLGIVIAPFVSFELIVNYDWRVAYVIIGIIALYSLSPMITILVIAQFLKRNQTA